MASGVFVSSIQKDCHLDVQGMEMVAIVKRSKM